MKTKLIQLIRGLGRRTVIGIPYAWLLLFFLLPFIIVLKVSLAESGYYPPYHPLLAWAEDQVSIVLYYGNYLYIFKDDDWNYLPPYVALIKAAIIVTIICLILAYLIAIALTKLKSTKLQNILLWSCAAPTVIALLLNLYAYAKGNQLTPDGLVNYFLITMGFINDPITLLNTKLFIYLGLILTYLSLALFPLFYTLNQIDYEYGYRFDNRIVAPDGPSQGNTLWLLTKYIFRLSKKTLLLSASLVFICIVGKYIIPNPLGLTSFESSRFLSPYLNSIELALFSTLLCLMVGYPMAYTIAKARKEFQTVLILLIVMPTWTALLVRVYAWMTILGNGEQGLMNQLLMSLGLIQTPIEILNSYTAVYIGIVYAYLPFMILPLYANISKHDESLLEAAADLGARKLKAFWQITIPLSKEGIIAGCMLVFIPVIGEFVVPELLGGSETQLIGQAIYREYFTNNDWAAAAALAVIMLILLIIPIVLFNKNQNKVVEG